LENNSIDIYYYMEELWESQVAKLRRTCGF